MLFSDNIPDEVIENTINTKKFISVLDALQVYKQGIINDTMRAKNPLLCTNRRWLLRYLVDLGFSNVPYGMPIAVLQQLILNADLVQRLRGSKLGLEVFCSVCTLGSVTVDDSDFLGSLDVILLNSEKTGYVTSDNALRYDYIISDNEQLTSGGALEINIKTPYAPGGVMDATIDSYLKQAIEEYIGFHVRGNITITYEYASERYYHDLLNKRFINE